jgi:FkbM family methyltransferase
MVRPQDLIKQAFAKRGYSIVHREFEEGDAIPLFEWAVERLLTVCPEPYFVQVGANDGVRDDPIRHLILKHSLRGLLVEPVPSLFNQLQQNYAGTPGLIFENSAIMSTDGVCKLYFIPAAPDVPDWALGNVSFDPQVLLKHANEIPNVKNRIESVDVTGLSVTSLLKKHAINAVNILQVDAEGFDYQVIKMFLEAGLRPEVIHYEFIHLSYEDQARCREMLGAAGYRVMNVGSNTVASTL